MNTTVWKVCIHDLSNGSMYELQNKDQPLVYNTRECAQKCAQKWASDYIEKSCDEYEICTNIDKAKFITITHNKYQTVFDKITETVEEIEEKPVMIKGYISNYVRIVKVPVQKNIIKTVPRIIRENNRVINIYLITSTVSKPHQVNIPSPPVAVYTHSATSHLSQEIIAKHKQMFPNFNNK